MSERANGSFYLSAEDMDCRYCLRYIKGKGCMEQHCPWIKERIQSGALSYQTAIINTFGEDSLLEDRLKIVSSNYSGTLWTDESHIERMIFHLHPVSAGMGNHSPCYYAALYLMTSNPEIYRRTLLCFPIASIDFKKADVKWITEYDYTLLMAAKGIYCHSNKISMQDLEDREIIPDGAFCLIVNAFLIRRYGQNAFLLRNMTNSSVFQARQ